MLMITSSENNELELSDTELCFSRVIPGVYVCVLHNNAFISILHLLLPPEKVMRNVCVQCSLNNTLKTYLNNVVCNNNLCVSVWYLNVNVYSAVSGECTENRS